MASLLSYFAENLLAAIFLYSRGILNFFVRIVPFAFRWRLEKCRFTSSCTASSRTPVPHGPCQQLLSLILAKSAWLAVRFPKARNRKMGTESNLHSSPFGMKIEQVYKGMWIQSSYFPSLRLSTYTIYSFGGRSQIVDIFSSRYLFAGAHIFVDIFVWKYLFAGVLIKDIFIWKYLFAGAQGWWGQAGADMSRFQTFNSVCKFAIPGFAFWFGHSVCK